MFPSSCVCYVCVWQDHDPFCEAIHLNGVVLPVSLVVNPVTGAQRMITQGKITAPISNSSNKLAPGGSGEDFALINTYIHHVGERMHCTV